MRGHENQGLKLYPYWVRMTGLRACLGLSLRLSYYFGVCCSKDELVINDHFQNKWANVWECTIADVQGRAGAGRASALVLIRWSCGPPAIPALDSFVVVGCHINNPGDGFNRCDYKHCGPNADSNEFCCCNTSMCNSEIFDPDASPELLSRTDLYQRDEHPPLMSTAHILLIGAGIIVLLAFGGIYIMWRLWMRKKLEYQVSTVEEDEISTKLFQLVPFLSVGFFQSIF